MDLHIENKKFLLDWDWGFNEKISHLRKKESIKFRLHLYTPFLRPVMDDKSELSIDISEIEKLSKLHETIYVSKNDRYWWCFYDCQLIDIKISEDKNYSDYKGRLINKFDIELLISYKEVCGSNKKSVLERDLKIKKLFD